MNISLYREPYQRVYYLSFSSRSLQSTFCCIERPFSWSSPFPIPTEDFNAHLPVQRALSAGLSLSYSSRSLQCTFSCIERPISGCSPCPILPEVFYAHFRVQSTLSAGLISVIFPKKSSMHISHYRETYQMVQSLSYSSRSLPCTFPIIESPIRWSSPCLIPQEVFNAHFLVQSTI